MNQVTVEFIGICTHVSQQTTRSLPVRQRVVLLKAAEGVEVHGVGIAPHVAYLKIDGGASIRLDGVTLSLALQSSSAVRPPFVRDQTFEKLPNLSQLVAPILPLSPASPYLVLDEPASEVACYFDIDFGTLTAALSSTDAAAAVLTAESDQSSFELVARPFPGTSLPAGLSERMPLASQARITVANVDARSETKSDADFLLHYRTAGQMPPIPQIPQHLSLQESLPRRTFFSNVGTVGAGCSNSNYP